MPAAGKKLHHFVSRFYLRAWAEDDLLFCLQDGATYNPNVRNVAAENYFYKLEELNDEEISLLAMFINNSPETLRETHRELVRMHMAPFAWKHALEEEGNGTPAEFAHIERQINELSENLHTAIEDSFHPFLTRLREGDALFLDSSDTRAKFYGGFAAQYVRTKFLEGAEAVLGPEKFDLFIRTSNILVQIFALNVGLSLFADAANRSPYMLHNTSNIPFITADQPIINLAANPKKYDPPSRFECYYPVSPSRALLLLEPQSRFQPPDLSVTDEDARKYNLTIAAHSKRQIFSNSQAELEAINSELAAFLSCF